MSEEHNITDSYQRRVSYLRFSVTDTVETGISSISAYSISSFIPSTSF